MENPMLPKKYKPKESEPKWQQFWADHHCFDFDPQSEKPIYSVDTPPPTVSGVLHIGHVYSYTQAEIIARYQRMKGKNVFYPFGFDDNGLPTERYVEKTKKVRGKNLGRSEFNQLCREAVAELEDEFKSLWTSLGFSADWNLTYSTIEDLCQRVSQRSFLDLYEKGLVEHRDEPNMWCVECQTAIAQAELESQDRDSNFSDLSFPLVDGGDIIIGTTRPELLPSCVCIFVHPTDKRYTNLVGKKARVPIFGQEIPILSDEGADMEKGTGAVMCCTFGDKTDIDWYKKHLLPLRISITSYGRMTDLAQDFAGQKIKEARKNILERLEETGHLKKTEEIQHPVNTHERCSTDIEFLVTRQWFIKLMDHKQELLDLADKMNWYPAFMKQRYVHWVENLGWDWCISRQRFFGVPFPVWHCANCEQHILADAKKLPVDPSETPAPSPCPGCGSTNLKPDENIMDTWATSSVTPQINYRWGEKDSLEKQLAPMGMRPQAHDIIRTWAFYTMAKAWFHQGDIPWKDIMISGHVLYKKGHKISKSKGKRQSEPEQLIERYSADVIRYWTAGAKLGSDCYFEEQEFKIAGRLVTKIFNASRFALSHLEEFDKPDPRKITFPIDRGLVSILQSVIDRADQHLQAYEYSLALSETESFFWGFCDNYLELVKHRVYNPQEHGPGGGDSAKNTLYTVLFATLRLLAPYIPHITEEIYQSAFRQIENEVSIHLCSFPEKDLALVSIEDEKSYLDACSFIGAVRKFKTENRLSLNTELSAIHYQDQEYPALNETLTDVSRAAGCDKISNTSNLDDQACVVELEGRTLNITL